jgi:hypothetical protein
MSDKCPFCGAELKQVGSGMSPYIYSCGTRIDEYNERFRTSHCYESELTALRARNEKLERVAKATKEAMDNITYSPFVGMVSTDYLSNIDKALADLEATDEPPK